MKRYMVFDIDWQTGVAKKFLGTCQEEGVFDYGAQGDERSTHAVIKDTEVSLPEHFLGGGKYKAIGMFWNNATFPHLAWIESAKGQKVN